MKRLACGILLAAMACSLSARAELNDGLLLYYGFDSNTGATVPDLSGNHHTGRVFGATFAGGGRFGGAYRFDGVDDHILGGNLGHVPQGTIAFWMNAEVVENWRNPFSTDYASWDDGLRFEEDSGGDFVMGLGPLLGGALFTESLQPRTWYHVAFAWTASGYWGWLDGQPVFSGMHNNQLYLDFVNVAVGNGYSTDPIRYWKGLVDEVRIYNRVLAADEVVQLATPPDAGDLLLHYGFDTNECGVVTDQSPYGNQGLVNGADYTYAGAGSGCYELDGISDEIRVPDSWSLNPTGGITVAAWFKCTGPGTHNGVILLKGSAARGLDAGQYGLIYFPNNHQGVMGKVAFSLRTANNGWWHDYYSTATFGFDTWHHVAGTYKPGQLNLYVDGQPARPTENVTGAVAVKDGDLFIGADHAFPEDEFFKGFIDDVRVYSRALPAAEVLGLYQVGPPEEGGPAAFVETLGFSNDPNGDQDVTVFAAAETLFIRLNDVDLPSDAPGARARVYLQQPGRRGMPATVRLIALAPQPDGSFTGSIALSPFRPGNVRVTVVAEDVGGGACRLTRRAQITILAP